MRAGKRCDVLEKESRRCCRLELPTALRGLAVMLAAVSIYGVMSYSVTQRTIEIGIRMSLGADRASVLRMVMGQGLRLAAIGLAIGLAVALGVTRVMSKVLFGVSPTDPMTFATILFQDFS